MDDPIGTYILKIRQQKLLVIVFLNMFKNICILNLILVLNTLSVFKSKRIVPHNVERCMDSKFHQLFECYYVYDYIEIKVFKIYKLDIKDTNSSF